MGVNNLKKKKRKGVNQSKQFKVNGSKPSKVKPKDLDDNLEFGQYLGDDKIISTDRENNTKIILHTFIGEEELKQPDEMDTFIANSLELASKEDNFLPWISGDFKNLHDEISDAISKAECKDLSDSIDSSGIVNFSQQKPKFKTEKLEVE